MLQKKYPEYHLGSVLLEQCIRKRDPEQLTRVDDECVLFQNVLRECGQAEQDLAKEQAEHEIKVEQMVSSPLQAVLDNDLPNILKQKRNLNKHILDKDSASSRYNVCYLICKWSFFFNELSFSFRQLKMETKKKL